MSWFPAIPTKESLSSAFAATQAAASAAASHAHQLAKDKGYISEPSKCAMCLAVAAEYTMPGSETCTLCSKWLCTEHVKKSCIVRKVGDKYCVPAALLPPLKEPGEKTMKERVFGEKAQLICGLGCKQRCAELWMQAYMAETAVTMRVDKLQQWVAEHQCSFADEVATRHFSYSVPTASKEDFNKRAWIATYKLAKNSVGLGLGGYGELVMQGFILGTQGLSLFSYLKGMFGLNDDMYALIQSLGGIMLPKLRQLKSAAEKTKGGSSGTSLPATGTYTSDAYLGASVFYLSADHNLTRLQNLERISADIASSHWPVCPNSLLDKIGSCLNKAQWLYSCNIPGIHDTKIWTEWFLCKVLLRQGWCLVGCNLDSVLVPTGNDKDCPVICPCFALAVQQDAAGVKRAVLCIRGTKTAGDVLIDLDHEPAPLALHSLAGGQAAAEAAVQAGRGADVRVDVVEGHVHAGMLRGATCMLEHCHVYTMLDALVEQGFALEIVGHSLGAGIATITAILLHNRYLKALLAPAPYIGPKTLPSIDCVGLGAPPVACAALSAALARDGLVVSVVNRHDVISRMSFSTLSTLATELGAYQATATVELDKDLASYKAYAASLGAASKRQNEDASAAAEAKSQVDQVMADLDLHGSKPQQREAEAEAAAAASPAQSGTGPEGPPVLLVPPGQVVYIHQGSDGQMEAYLGDHTLPTLQTIRLTHDCITDHYNKSYFAALRTLRHARVVAGTMAPPPGSVGGAIRRPHLSPLQDASGAWLPCSVCEEDTTWPYITKSTSSRASATHHCMACGKICCSVCAPAGDQIPDDGLNQYVSVDDLRIPLPLSGLMNPQRVCLPCFFGSYSL